MTPYETRVVSRALTRLARSPTNTAATLKHRAQLVELELRLLLQSSLLRHIKVTKRAH